MPWTNAKAVLLNQNTSTTIQAASLRSLTMATSLERRWVCQIRHHLAACCLVLSSAFAASGCGGDGGASRESEQPNETRSQGGPEITSAEMPMITMGVQARNGGGFRIVFPDCSRFHLRTLVVEARVDGSQDWIDQWGIIQRRESARPKGITYGRVPAGFRQRIGPRPLPPASTVSVHVVFESATETFQFGITEFRIRDLPTSNETVRVGRQSVELDSFVADFAEDC